MRYLITWKATIANWDKHWFDPDLLIKFGVRFRQISSSGIQTDPSCGLSLLWFCRLFFVHSCPHFLIFLSVFGSEKNMCPLTFPIIENVSANSIIIFCRHTSREFANQMWIDSFFFSFFFYERTLQISSFTIKYKHKVESISLYSAYVLKKI